MKASWFQSFSFIPTSSIRFQSNLCTTDKLSLQLLSSVSARLMVILTPRRVPSLATWRISATSSVIIAADGEIWAARLPLPPWSVYSPSKNNPNNLRERFSRRKWPIADPQHRPHFTKPVRKGGAGIDHEVTAGAGRKAIHQDITLAHAATWPFGSRKVHKRARPQTWVHWLCSLAYPH